MQNARRKKMIRITILVLRSIKISSRILEDQRAQKTDGMCVENTVIMLDIKSTIIPKTRIFFIQTNDIIISIVGKIMAINGMVQG